MSEARSHKKVPLTVRFEREIYRALKDLSDRHACSLSAACEHVVRSFFLNRSEHPEEEKKLVELGERLKELREDLRLSTEVLLVASESVEADEARKWVEENLG